jgi:AcrR family transcriptional regulator
MGRPRTFDTDEALDAALGVFWRHGFEGASLARLEKATGLSRSSLYQAFGDKEALFDKALGRYRTMWMNPQLAALEQPDAGPSELRAYFRTLAAGLRADPALARRGCLFVNSMAELGAARGGSPRILTEHLRRLTGLFDRALGQNGRSPLPGHQTGDTLVAALFGVLVTVRVDPALAARQCDSLADGLTTDELPPRTAEHPTTGAMSAATSASRSSCGE